MPYPEKLWGIAKLLIFEAEDEGYYDYDVLAIIHELLHQWREHKFNWWMRDFRQSKTVKEVKMYG